MGSNALKVSGIVGILVALTILSYGMLRSSGSIGNTIQSLQHYNATQSTYRALVQQTGTQECPSVPCSYVNGNNFTYVFRALNGEVVQWSFPASVYNKYSSTPSTLPILVFNDTYNNKRLYTYDYSVLVTPSVFSSVVGNLTRNRTASQFVDEVFSLREQLTTYSNVFSNTSVYPTVVLATREGDCKDLAVLMASILEAGNTQAGYGMKIQLLYMDYPNFTSPQVINHIVIDITYSNGTSQIVETTGDVMDPYKSVDGWYVNLTCNATSCEQVSSCPAGEVMGFDGICHAECGTSGTYCSSGSSCYENHCISCGAGYTLGSDGQCHAECGSSTTYCSNGATCYNGKCVTCSPGEVIGTDGACHETCGTGYCASGSSCYDNHCVACPTGYSLGSNGQCYHN